MLGENLALSFSMVIVLVLSNLLATAVCIAITRPGGAHRVAQEQPADPGAVAVVLFGSYVAYPHPLTLVFVLVFGVVGYLMMRFDWARARCWWVSSWVPSPRTI